ncbi:ABC transporter substrate-binding protein [Zavarzinia compransoris]|uniref:ABC transporter substrate-binding protein n=1 Tax=Zavarzinia compransoris TaxID=1264899 RepID=UPI001AAC4FF3|nr:ABC transporter substrate-binding protein [Zavarzinia compransoris]
MIRAPITLDRRRALAAGGGLFLALMGAGPARAALDFTDIRGRPIHLDGPARALMIDDSRYLVALSMISPEPIARVAAWPRDLNRLGATNFKRFQARFPAIDGLARVPSSSESFEAEPVLAAMPDVAIFTLNTGPSDAQVALLEAAGIKVVFLDFFTAPFRHQAPSFEILGRLIGREDQAAAFNKFRQQRLDRIAARLAGATGTPPKVFVEVHAGISPECCNSPGKGNVSDYIAFVGGHNIGADVLATTVGRLNLEYVIEAAPDIYVATGGSHLEKAGGLVIGAGYDRERVLSAFRKMAGRPGIAQLGAVTGGRAHGLAHELLNSPLDILAVESLARWIRPDLFADLDPAATMAEINRDFLAIPLDGTYWIDLPPI